MTAGYICFKGVNATEAHNSPDRLRHPLKRRPDGTFQQIGLEQALDEIAEIFGRILAEEGPEAVGLFVGNGAFPNATAAAMHYDFMRAIGSDNRFTSVTIDQSAKAVSFERLGAWAAGLPPFDHSNVAILFGTNPLVSHGMPGMLEVDPSRRLKKAKARGFKLIVIDPRRTETARHADLFLQPYPGQDTAIAAGLLRLILEQGRENAAFCERWVGGEGMAKLRKAVAPFEAEYVETRAGLKRGDLQAVVDMFTADDAWGAAFAATGCTMSPFANLSHHLIDNLNVVCGRFAREGDLVPSADMMLPFATIRAQAIAPPRSFMISRASRIRGAGSIFGERMTATLADEILTTGQGQIKALLVDGGNPAASVPDQNHIVDALSKLELLVTIDPFMTPTAKLSHYVLPSLMQYEREDLPLSLYGSVAYPVPWVAYTPAISPPPPGSALIEDWYFFWSIAKRLNRQIVYAGKQALDMQTKPSTDDLLAIRASNPAAPLDLLKTLPAGKVFDDLEPRYVQPAEAGASGQFGVMPDDVQQELARFLAAAIEPGKFLSQGMVFSHLLAVRRSPNIYNSHGRDLPTLRRRQPFNPAFLHSEDLAAQGLQSGDRVIITSDNGRITAIVEADDTVRPGVVSMSHGWGGLPGDGESYEAAGASVNQLISTGRDLDTLHMMPRMSAIPVNITKSPQLSNYKLEEMSDKSS